MTPLGPLGPLHDDPAPAPPPPGGADGRPPKMCIYPGCTRPAVPPHLLGGPQPSFCDLEEHNALTTHQERQRLAAEQRSKEGVRDGE
ncbi:MAG TPA: hypothetical protein VIK04_08955 [Solirubrobacteraceae bacterium]